MNTWTVYFVVVLVTGLSTARAQSKHMKLTERETGKEVILKENTRVRVKAEEFRRAGRLKIMEGDQLMIRNKVLNVSDIQKIKRQPLAMIIVVDGGLLLISAVATGIAIGGALYTGQAELLLVLIPAGLLMDVSIRTPNPLPAYRPTRWDIKIEK